MTATQLIAALQKIIDKHPQAADQPVTIIVQRQYPPGTGQNARSHRAPHVYPQINSVGYDQNVYTTDPDDPGHAHLWLREADMIKARQLKQVRFQRAADRWRRP